MNSDLSVDHQDLDEMTCQLCLARAATHRVTDRSPASRSDHRYYCLQCYAAKYVKSPPPGHGFRRPRFTIKNVMVLVALFSIPNAIAAWVMRSGYITGTPVELRRWRIYVFLAVNLVPGFFGLFIAAFAWIDRARIYNRTGGVRVPQIELTPRHRRTLIILLFLYVAWFAVALILAKWLVPMVWPAQPPGCQPFFLVLVAPLPLIFVVRLSTDRATRNRLRQDWKAASGPERVLRVVLLAWFGCIILMLGFGDCLGSLSGSSLWFRMALFVLFGNVVPLLLFAALAMSTRAR